LFASPKLFSTTNGSEAISTAAKHETVRTIIGRGVVVAQMAFATYDVVAGR